MEYDQMTLKERAEFIADGLLQLQGHPHFLYNVRQVAGKGKCVCCQTEEANSDIGCLGKGYYLCGGCLIEVQDRHRTLWSVYSMPAEITE